jgi:hypothetical protein
MEREERETTEQPKKRPYEKPSVRAIPLRPDEAVLAVCKSSNHSGPGGGSNCNPVGPVCSVFGS